MIGLVWRVAATEADLEPWCLVTEGTWTWFGAILLTLVLVVAFNLKYYRKVISKPKNLRKVTIMYFTFDTFALLLG